MSRSVETKRMTAEVQGSFVRRKVRCSSQVLSTCSTAFRRLTTIGSTPASPFEASLTMKETRDYLVTFSSHS
ncbi:hypothetical protein ALC60_03268 [Trachymyrmex zeteki]|uniref:Uncharacterized protein n=1 Tax=Mycetomoellerius zeteki TaxID=64791 RepID=A0A151XBM0_9HYME|nr:hypothetical protein ALC60_03268 [Trachymyrmex zeteki]